MVVLGGALGLALAAVLVPPPAVAAPNNPPVARRGGMVGALAPPFRASHVRGPDPVSMQDLRGRVVLLDFWATWCGPCRMVMPYLDGLHRQYHDRGLTVLGVSVESSGVIRRHLVRHPVAYTVAHDGTGMSRSFGIRAIPTLVLIDRQGKVRQIYAGLNGARLRELSSLVPRLLDEPRP